MRIDGSRIQDENIIIKVDNKSYYKTISVDNVCNCACHQIDHVTNDSLKDILVRRCHVNIKDIIHLNRNKLFKFVCKHEVGHKLLKYATSEAKKKETDLSVSEVAKNILRAHELKKQKRKLLRDKTPKDTPTKDSKSKAVQKTIKKKQLKTKTCTTAPNCREW